MRQTRTGVPSFEGTGESILAACRRIHDSDAQEKRRSGMLHLVISRSRSLS